jgi:hypothetical protein
METKIKALFCGLLTLLIFSTSCQKTGQISADQSSVSLVGLNPNRTSSFVAGTVYIHPGLLHTQADFIRMQVQVSAGTQPYLDGWNKLTANSHGLSTYTMQGPIDTVYRGTGTPENYSKLYNDVAAAYQNALRWKVNGDVACANKAVAIMNAWSATLKVISGNADRWLAAGIYGYEFANAAEIMRDYSGWSSTDFNRFKSMMLNIFYPMNHDFLTNHNGACITNYWANWDLCSMASIIAIGILCDDSAKVNEAVDYFKTGAGNGSIDHAVPFLYAGGLGQGQESGRDQGHQGLDVSLLGAFCQMAYNQGVDLFGYESNKALAVCEYTASYNLGNTVPFTTYNWGSGVNCSPNSQTVISTISRGDVRPSWELIYNHFHNVIGGLTTTYSGQYATNLRPEGGGGDYGTTSGGYDQLGFGTLTYTVGAQPITNGTYHLVNRGSGKYLDNLGATTDGAGVGQWASSTSNNQKWTLAYNGGYFTLTCVSSGKCLDGGGNVANGATVVQWTSNGGTNQQWTLVPVGGSYYKIVNRTSGKCVDSNGGTANGSLMKSYPSGTTNNQQWSIAP